MALHLEMLGYILGLLKGFKYLRNYKLGGLTLTVGNKVRKLLVEVGILTEDAAFNIRGDIVIYTLFVIFIFVCMGVIPSRKE